MVEYDEFILKRPPIFRPNLTPAYSNVGFVVLGHVVEAVARRSYDEVIAEALIKPLGLSRSKVWPPPNSSDGIIVPGTTEWDTDLAIWNP
jgi:CubicO group peptidase (beta-lactamase class C family)